MRRTAYHARITLTVALLVLVLASVGTGAAGAATDLFLFHSPSGNINCVVFPAPDGGADCLVRTASWAHLPAKPRTCHTDWSPTVVQLGRTAVSLGACRSDFGPTCYPDAGCRVLPYGRSVTVGTIRCSSAPDGITCRRTTGRRPGFRVAREGVVVFR